MSTKEQEDPPPISLASVFQAIASWGKFRVPEELARGLELGGDGAAVLLLRHARTGTSWHEAVGLAPHSNEVAEAPDDWSRRVRALEVPIVGKDAHVDALRAWWGANRRPLGKALRGLTTSEPTAADERRSYAHWLIIEGTGAPYVALPSDAGLRAQRLARWRRRGGAGDDGGGVDTLPGEIVNSFVTWEQTRDGVAHVAIEIEAAPGGIVLAVLLLSSPTAERKRMFDAVVANAWTIAEVVGRAFWALWERFHNRLIVDAIPRVMSVDPAAVPTSPASLFRLITAELDPVVRAIAGAMQAPVAGLFLSTDDKKVIDLISHVGYQQPGVPQTFAYETGLTRLFSWDVRPIVRAYGERRAVHLPSHTPDDPDALVRTAYRHFGLAEASGKYESDTWVLETLKPIAELGPWAYGCVPFDSGMWPAPRRIEQRPIAPAARDMYRLESSDVAPGPAAVLKVYGRVRSEIDASVSPPFAARELVGLHRWSKLVGAVLQRVAAVYANHLSHRVIQGAAVALSRSLQHLVDYLRDALSPQAVLLVADTGDPDEFEVVAERWHTKMTEAEVELVRGRVVSAVDGAPARSALASPQHTGLEVMIDRGPYGDPWNCHFRPVLMDGAPRGLLVVVGAPSNLQPNFREGSRSRSFPPTLRPTIEIVTAMLAGRRELERGGGSLPAAWQRLLRVLKRKPFATLSVSLKGKLDDLATDVAASFRHQHELAELLAVEPQTVRRQLLKLTGGDDQSEVKWSALGSRGRASTPVVLARRIEALLDEIGDG